MRERDVRFGANREWHTTGCGYKSCFACFPRSFEPYTRHAGTSSRQTVSTTWHITYYTTTCSLSLVSFALLNSNLIMATLERSGSSSYSVSFYYLIYGMWRTLFGIRIRHGNDPTEFLLCSCSTVERELYFYFKYVHKPNSRRTLYLCRHATPDSRIQNYDDWNARDCVVTCISASFSDNSREVRHQNEKISPSREC